MTNYVKLSHCTRTPVNNSPVDSISTLVFQALNEAFLGQCLCHLGNLRTVRPSQNYLKYSASTTRSPTGKEPIISLTIRDVCVCVVSHRVHLPLCTHNNLPVCPMITHSVSSCQSQHGCPVYLVSLPSFMYTLVVYIFYTYIQADYEPLNHCRHQYSSQLIDINKIEVGSKLALLLRPAL